jgi:hypothetical protein
MEEVEEDMNGQEEVQEDDLNEQSVDFEEFR